MKLIHYLRDNGHPLINMFDALDIMFDELNINHPNRDKKEIPTIGIQMEYLAKLREIA